MFFLIACSKHQKIEGAATPYRVYVSQFSTFALVTYLKAKINFILESITKVQRCCTFAHNCWNHTFTLVDLNLSSNHTLTSSTCNTRKRSITVKPIFPNSKQNNLPSFCEQLALPKSEVYTCQPITPSHCPFWNLFQVATLFSYGEVK